MHQQPLPARRWTPAEERLLYQLRVTEKRTWSEVAQALDRTTTACSRHYYKRKGTEFSSAEDWDAAMDEQIIDGRRQDLSSKKIGAEMGLPTEAVQGRWLQLKEQREVPEDVLALRRKKGEVTWSHQEDEAILQAWKDGKDEEEIVQSMKFEGKGKPDIRQRYKLLRREMGPIYRRVMGLDDLNAKLVQTKFARKK